jgi:hypothetical protein
MTVPDFIWIVIRPWHFYECDKCGDYLPWWKFGLEVQRTYVSEYAGWNPDGVDVQDTCKFCRYYLVD